MNGYKLSRYQARAIALGLYRNIAPYIAANAADYETFKADYERRKAEQGKAIKRRQSRNHRKTR